MAGLLASVFILDQRVIPPVPLHPDLPYGLLLVSGLPLDSADTILHLHV